MNPISDESMVNETRSMIERRPSGSSIDHAGRNKSIMGRLVRILMLVVVVIGGVVFVLYKMRVDIPALNTPALAYLDSMGAARRADERVLIESHFGKHAEEEAHDEQNKIVVTSPMAKDVTITQDYVCQIHSQRHIESVHLEDGYLEAIPIKEGQAVKKGELMFQVVPILYKAELAAEVAERDLAQMELNYTETLAAKKGVSQKEVSCTRPNWQRPRPRWIWRRPN